MRFAWIAVSAPLFLAACGDDEAPVIVNTPAEEPAGASVVVPDTDDEAVVIDPDDGEAVIVDDDDVVVDPY